MSKKLLNIPWSQIIKALAPSIYPTIIVAIASLSVRSLLLFYELPAWFILGTTTLASGLSLLGLYVLRPQILGFYGMETLKKFLPSLPIKIFPKTISQWILAKLEKAS